MSFLTAFESCLSMAAIHVSPPVIPIALRLWFKRSECTSTCTSTDRRPEWSSLTLTPTRTRESPLSCDKGHDLRAPCRLSVSRGQSTLPYLLLLSMPRHTSSLSSSHALSSTLRRKTLSRLLSASLISTQKGLSTRAIPDTRLLNPSRLHPTPYTFSSCASCASWCTLTIGGSLWLQI